jgi:hypothetical protein
MPEGSIGGNQGDSYRTWQAAFIQTGRLILFPIELGRSRNNWQHRGENVSEPVKWANEPEQSSKAFRCPCCKFKTLHGRGQDEICQVCFWHDDGQDEADAERVLGGPNRHLSLRQARVNFKSLGAIEEQWKPNVRPPKPDEL